MIKWATYIAVVGIGLTAFLRCASSDSRETIPPRSNQIAVPDSIFERFESLADTASYRYVSDPDSFLNSFALQPHTILQKEMYVFGLLYMAYGLRKHGDHYNSIRYYEKTLYETDRFELDDVDKPLYIYKPLAALYTLIDDNEKSIQLLERVLTELPPDDHDQRAGFANNLANAYLYNNELEKAEKLVLETLDKPAPPLALALLYNTLSTVYQYRGLLRESISANRHALRLFGSAPVNGDTLVWYGSALAQHGELNRDIKSAKKALNILKENFPNSQHRSKASAQLVIANMYDEGNDVEHARESYRQVIEQFHLLGSDFVLDYKYTQALVGLAQCHAREHVVDSALHYYQWAIENDFRTQQLITSQHNQINNNIWNRDIVESMSTLIHDQLTRDLTDEKLIQTLLWCVELSKGRLLINEINRSENWVDASPTVKEAIRNIRQLHQRLTQTQDEQQINMLERKIQQMMIDFQLSERYFETIRYTPIPEKFAADLCHQDRGYYSYFVHRDSTITILGLSNGQYVYRKTTDRNLLANLKQFKQDYFGETPNNYNIDPQSYREKAAQYAKVLLPELAENPSDFHLSLDGELYGLPFDALYNNGFLVERHNIGYINSFILYDLLRSDPSEHTDITLLYRSEFPDPLPNLSFAQEEVEQINRRFAGKLISPAAQDDSTIVTEFASARAIHIASHTLLDSTENPILYLRRPISTAQLRFYHIYSPLIFLSACNTASGRPLPSEGMESIQRIFLSKGVPSVISTYWLANDEVMLDLTTMFYEELKKSRRPVKALADAKRALLQTASVEQRNPWYWSNINYAGVDNEIGLRKSSNLSFWLIFGLICLVIAGVLFVYRSFISSRIGREKQRILQRN